MNKKEIITRLSYCIIAIGEVMDELNKYDKKFAEKYLIPKEKKK